MAFNPVINHFNGLWLREVEALNTNVSERLKSQTGTEAGVI